MSRYSDDSDYDAFNRYGHEGDINVNNFVQIGNQHNRRRPMPDFGDDDSSDDEPPRPQGPWRFRRRYGVHRGAFEDNNRVRRPPPRPHPRLRQMTNVRLPEGGGCQISRDNISRHLPNADRYTHNGLLDVNRWLNEYASCYPDIFMDFDDLAEGLILALNVFLRNLDGWAEEDFTHMFDAQRYQLDHAQGPWDPIFPKLLVQMHAVSCICDQDMGLGCSQELGFAMLEVGVTVSEYLPMFGIQEDWQALFGAMSRVLTDGCREHSRMLAEVWDALPDGLRQYLVMEMAMSPEPGPRRTRRALEREGRM